MVNSDKKHKDEAQPKINEEMDKKITEFTLEQKRRNTLNETVAFSSNLLSVEEADGISSNFIYLIL